MKPWDWSRPHTRAVQAALAAAAVEAVLSAGGRWLLLSLAAGQFVMTAMALAWLDRRCDHMVPAVTGRWVELVRLAAVSGLVASTAVGPSRAALPSLGLCCLAAGLVHGGREVFRGGVLASAAVLAGGFFVGRIELTFVLLAAGVAMIGAGAGVIVGGTFRAVGRDARRLEDVLGEQVWGQLLPRYFARWRVGGDGTEISRPLNGRATPAAGLWLNIVDVRWREMAPMEATYLRCFLSVAMARLHPGVTPSECVDLLVDWDSRWFRARAVIMAASPPSVRFRQGVRLLRTFTDGQNGWLAFSVATGQPDVLEVRVPRMQAHR